MEDVGISLAEAAELFGISEATLYNWRSTVGVPDRKLGWVRSRMVEYEQAKQAADVREPRETRPGFFEIFATDEELHRSDRASRLAGAESLAAWCHDVILAETDRALAVEEAAGQTGSGDASNPPKSLALVAEEGKAYRPNPSPSGDAAPASDIELLPRRSEEETA